MSGFSSGVARAHVRKDDTVLVRRGRDRGRRGRSSRSFWKTGQVFVEKLNLVKRHTKPNPRTSRGNHRERGPIALSNVMLVCPGATRRRAPEEGPRVRRTRTGVQELRRDDRSGLMSGKEREIMVRLREHYGKEVVSAS